MALLNGQEVDPFVKSVDIIIGLGWTWKSNEVQPGLHTRGGKARIGFEPKEIPNLYDVRNFHLAYLVYQQVEFAQDELAFTIGDDYLEIRCRFCDDTHLPLEQWIEGWLDVIYMMVQDLDEEQLNELRESY